MPWSIKGIKKCQAREAAEAKAAGKPYRIYPIWNFYWLPGEKRGYVHDRHCANDYPNRVTDDTEWKQFIACIRKGKKSF